MTRYLAENGMCFLRGFAEFVHHNVIRLEVEMIKLMIENVVVVWWHVWLLTLFWKYDLEAKRLSENCNRDGIIRIW